MIWFLWFGPTAPKNLSPAASHWIIFIPLCKSQFSSKELVDKKLIDQERMGALHSARLVKGCAVGPHYIEVEGL